MNIISSKLPVLASAALSVAMVLSSGFAIADGGKIKSQNAPKPSVPFDQITPSIVGGNPADQGSRTYQVSLGNGGCGGTIIADQWILTAAHCGSPSSVRVGMYNIGSNEGETHMVTQRIVHENYNSRTQSHDIALLKVSGVINPSYVRAKLPTADVMQNAASPGKMLTVSGWGRLTEGGSTPTKLHEVDVPVVSKATCNASNAYAGAIDNTMICAGYAAGGKDSCQGDSGGPLVAAYQSQIYSIGVVSWGDGCARPNKYGVYAETYQFVNWINSKIGGTTPPPPGDNVLKNGVAKTGLNASQGAELRYTLVVPAGASGLSFKISGGTGDADMYVRFGTAPTTSTWDCRPYRNGNNETCTISNVKAGTYHVMLRGYSAFSNVTLLATHN